MRIHTRIVAAMAATALATTALAASTLVAGAAYAAPSAKNPTLVVNALPAQVRLIPGESILLSLSTNLTTGYTWSTKVTGDKKSVKVFQGVYQAPASANGMVGVPGTTAWSIKALKPGTSVVNIIETAPGGAVGSTSKLKIIVMRG